MTSARVHTQSTAVVLLGSFNPRIFEPLWFSRNELISEQEAEQAEVQMIDRDFCRLRVDWIELVVVGERLQAQTTSETVSDDQIRDLLVGLLKLLPHTPIQRVLIHHRAEIAIENEDAWHAVGHALAPKELWEGVLDNPGMFDFAMLGTRPDDLQGSIKVRIQPSLTVQPGIFMNVNDEFLVSSANGGVVDVAQSIYELWPQAESRAQDIRERLLSRLVP